MAESWQSAWVQVLPDFSDFRRTANSEMTGILGAAGTAGGITAGQNMAPGILGGIKGLAAPILGAIAALGIGRLVGEAIGTSIRFGLEAVNFASGLAEQTNAVQVAFGDVGDEILALSEDAPKDLNLTRVAFDKLAVRFSAFATKIAGSGGDVAGVIKDLTQRGADFASVYDIEASEALELFQSGLAGETEPLRKFGIDLSAAAVEAYAYSHGINDGTHELTEAEKVQARYGALLEQTSQTQGDLANTAGSYANQQREFAVKLEEAQTKFGEAILPVANEFLTLANDTLLPKLSDALAEIGPELGAKLAEAAPAIGDLAIKLAEALPDLVTMATDSLPGIIQGMEDIAEAAPEWIDAFKTVDQAVYDMDAGFRDVQDSIIEWRQGVIDSWPAVQQSVRDATAPFNKAVNDFFAILFPILDGIPSRGRLAGEGLARGFKDGIDSGKAGAVNAAVAMAEETIFAARNVLGIASPSKVFAEIGEQVNAGFTEGLEKTRPTWTYDFTGITPSASRASGFPGEITLVDADGSILTRAKVIADSAVGQYAYDSDAALVGRPQ